MSAWPGLITDTTPDIPRDWCSGEQLDSAMYPRIAGPDRYQAARDAAVLLSSSQLQPDPRISNLRPAWLTDDQAWRDQLQALERDDTRWIERQWDIAGGAKPAVDTSWITWESEGDPHWAWPVLLAFALLIIGLVVAAAVELA